MQGFGEIRQIAYLCEDIEASMDAWATRAQVGPFTWYKNLTLPCVYKGELSNVEMHVGIAYRGSMQIELIQQINSAASPYRDFFERKQMGLHHLAFATTDIDDAVNKARDKGYEIIATINAVTGRYAYVQDSVHPELLFEFLEIPSDLEAFWAQSIKEAETWDGQSVVQEIDMRDIK